jgi:Thiamine pyrophosphate enzyme, N-terminal TPP binding domain
MRAGGQQQLTALSDIARGHGGQTVTEDRQWHPTVGDYLLERLRAWGVQHVFGYPGDGTNGVLEEVEVRRRHPRVRILDTARRPGGSGRATGRQRATAVPGLAGLPLCRAIVGV